MTPSLDELPTKVEELHLPWFEIKVFLLLGGLPTKCYELHLPRASRYYTLPKSDLEVVVAKGNLIRPRRNSTTGCSLTSYPGRIIIIIIIIYLLFILLLFDCFSRLMFDLALSRLFSIATGPQPVA